MAQRFLALPGRENRIRGHGAAGHQRGAGHIPVRSPIRRRRLQHRLGKRCGFQHRASFRVVGIDCDSPGDGAAFIRFDPTQAHWKSLPFDALGIFLLTAWPEELLFRGLLQNSFSRTFSSQTGGWIAASAVFGLAHINNNGVFPNWRYALLAAIAGIFYGRTWRKTGSIFPAAIVHALVDTTWHLLFRTL